MRGDTKKLTHFLMILQKNAKLTDAFKVTSLCHIILIMKAHKGRSCLTQCFNCQKFDHTSENCRQPPRCMWRGDSHIHKECPETNNRENSIPQCCSCKLKDGERPHSSNYRGCSHAKHELESRRVQRSSSRD
jgi:hypothetical protein